MFARNTISVGQLSFRISQVRNIAKYKQKFRLTGPQPLKFGLDKKLVLIEPKYIPIEIKSGDTAPLPDIDLKDFPNEFKKCEELMNAEELVQKIFSLEFLPRRQRIDELCHRMVLSVHQHNLDFDSYEARIARLTIRIRNLQIHMTENPTDGKNKSILIEMVQKRTKLLKLLRSQDYRCFEWLLERLELIYKPPLPVKHVVSRKKALHKLCLRYCNDMRTKKMTAYRKALEAQQIGFLKEKLETMKFIRKEEEECGVSPSITDEDLEKVVSKIKELEEKEALRIKEEAMHKREEIEQSWKITAT